ncbi:MAG: zinc-dependent alcohol dehydrogenase [Acidimicrobiales bacterium]
MKAIRVIDGTPTLVEETESNGDGVRIRIHTSSICGSDLHLLGLGIAEGMVLGHEFCGTTPDGTAVAVEPILGCGTCASCRSGHLPTCESGPTFLGIAVPGGMAESIVVPPETLVALPTGIPLSAGSLVEPLAVAHHGLDRARVRPEDRVLVIGAGPIGLATVAMLRDRGIACDISARHPHQQHAAEALGASLVVDGTYDVVMDCVATTTSLAEAMAHVVARGRVGLVGTLWDPAALSVTACVKEIELLPAMAYRCRVPERNFSAAATALATRPDIEAALITHRFPLDGCEEAFETAADRASGAIKVAFEV